MGLIVSNRLDQVLLRDQMLKKLLRSEVLMFGSKEQLSTAAV